MTQSGASSVAYSYLGIVELSPSTLSADDHFRSKLESNNSVTECQTSASGAEEPITTRSVEERIIDQLDYAQMCGDIIRQPVEATKLVSVEVSTNGIKFLSTTDQKSVERIAIHKLVQCLSYENEIGSCNVAIVVAKNDSNLTCHLLQTDNHDEADHLCEQILNAFHCIEREANAKYLEEKEHRQNELEQKRRIRKTAQ